MAVTGATSAEAATSAVATSTEGPALTADSPPPKDHVTLIAGGDVCLGRSIGQALLKDPAFDPFESVKRLLSTADLRFVNLESQLSDQKGETQSPTMKLKFTGPPSGADALARAHIDVVSAANNHMWDYGKDAFFATLDNLDRAKVRYAGAGRTREEAYSPAILTSGGLRVAFVAFTGIWNQGDLAYHEAKDHVARASREAVIAAVKAARATPGVDFVVVSYHGGEEYVSVPLQLAIDLHHAAIDAGADAVLGHHPHVTQGIEIYRGKPIFYSLGNFLMRTHGTHTETEIAHLARLTFHKKEGVSAWICPYRITGLVPHAVLLADETRRDLAERIFRQRVRVIQGSIVSSAKIASTEEDGCAKVTGP
ncbi:MAG: CapA family protein [Polyangiaceae bacterium]